MDKHRRTEHQWALVTGASSGLGRELARQLACDYGIQPLLVARREERLWELKRELEAACGVRSEVLTTDLREEEQLDEVFRRAVAVGNVSTLVLNAGVTYFGLHQQMDYRQFRHMMATNVNSIVRLTQLFLPHLTAQSDRTRILIVSSLAGLLPIPYQTAYSASKAFLCNFGLGLRHELRGTNVSVTVFAPGGIETELLHKSGLAARFGGSVFNHRADQCARSALRALWHNKGLHVPGVFNNAVLIAARLLPRTWMTSIIGHIYADALRELSRPFAQPTADSIHMMR
ncbi:MAG: oxidoreductase [Pirellulaceae bacterium]|nr:MAG: oxidoreductase [Pirellulaceae bacterium]